MKNKSDLDMPTTKRDLEDLGAHIILAVSKTMEDLATKEDIKRLETNTNDLATDIKKLENKVDLMGGDVSDIRRRVIDLETDTPTRTEFNVLKHAVASLTPHA